VDVHTGKDLYTCKEKEEIEVCHICCKGVPPLCVTDQIHCEIKRKRNEYNILYMILNVFMIFLFGPPIIIYILDKICIQRPCGARLSCFQCAVYSVCYYCCLLKRSNEHNSSYVRAVQDDEEEENELISNKKKMDSIGGSSIILNEGAE